MVRRREKVHRHVRPRGWRPYLTAGVAAHISEAWWGMPTESSGRLPSPTPYPSHLPSNRSRDPRKISLGFYTVDLADGSQREESTWERIRSEIGSRQEKFTTGSATFHHLATSMPLSAGWCVSSGPVRNENYPSGYHTTPAVDRGRSRDPLERRKGKRVATRGQETGLNSCLMRWGDQTPPLFSGGLIITPYSCTTNKCSLAAVPPSYTRVANEEP